MVQIKFSFPNPPLKKSFPDSQLFSLQTTQDAPQYFKRQ
jgi:hypothetical protein